MGCEWEGGRCGKVTVEVHFTPPCNTFNSLLPSGSQGWCLSSRVFYPGPPGAFGQVTPSPLDNPNRATQECEAQEQNRWLKFCPSPEQHRPSSSVRTPAALPRDGPSCSAHKISLAQAWIPASRADKPCGLTTLFFLHHYHITNIASGFGGLVSPGDGQHWAVRTRPGVPLLCSGC